MNVLKLHYANVWDEDKFVQNMGINCQKIIIDLSPTFQILCLNYQFLLTAMQNFLKLEILTVVNML